MITQTAESQSDLLPEEIISILKEGNKRFVNKRLVDRDLMEQVMKTSSGQFPFAVVISCIDSRVPPEIIFDLGLGDVLSIRVAGNVINDDVLGSVEFACKIAGVKLIVVMGHTSCGAVQGACNEVELGNLTGLLKKIKPAVESVSAREVEMDKSHFVDKVAYENVQISLNTIINDSPIINEMIENNEVKCAKGMYSVETGEVELDLL
jgi:carbonic anhydrase